MGETGVRWKGTRCSSFGREMKERAAKDGEEMSGKKRSLWSGGGKVVE